MGGTIDGAANSINQLDAAITRVTDLLDGLGRNDGLARFAKAAEQVASSFAKAEEKPKSFFQRLTAFGEKAAKVGEEATKFTKPMMDLGRSALEGAGGIQKMTFGLSRLLKPGEDAKSLVRDLTDLSMGSPLNLNELDQGARSLLSFGIAQDKVVDSLKMLADIGAGSETSLAALSELFGEASAKGTIDFAALKKLEDSGIQIIDELAAQSKVSREEFEKSFSGQAIPFTELNRAFTTLTASGGKYHGMLRAQGQTLDGLVGTYKNLKSNVIAQIGTIILDSLDAQGKLSLLTDWLQVGVQRLSAFADEYPEVASGIVVTLAALGSVGPAVTQMKEFIDGINNLMAAISILSTASLALLGIAAVVVALAVLGWLIYENWDAIASWLERQWDMLATNWSDFWNGLTESAKRTWSDIVSFIRGFDLSQLLSKAWEAAKSLWQELWSALPDDVRAALDRVLAFIAGLGIVQAMQKVIGGYLVIWDGIWTLVPNAVTDAVEKISGILAEFGLLDLISTIADTVSQSWRTLWNSFPDAVAAAWAAVQMIFQQADLFGLIQTAIETFLAVWDEAWNLIKAALSSAWTEISSIIDSISESLGRISSWFGELFANSEASATRPTLADQQAGSAQHFEGLIVLRLEGNTDGVSVSSISTSNGLQLAVETARGGQVMRG